MEQVNDSNRYCTKRQKDGRRAHGRMLDITRHSRRANYNNETPLRRYSLATIYKAVPRAGRDAERLKTSYVAGGNVKWPNFFGKQFGSLLKVHNTNLRSTRSTPGCLPKSNEGICLSRQRRVCERSAQLYP